MLFPIAIERGDDTHAYGVTVPDIPGCFSAGDTLAEAMTNAVEAIEGHLSVLCDDGSAIPVASDLDLAYKSHPELQGYAWAVVDVDVARFMGKTEKINVTLPGYLIRVIDEKVASAGKFKSRSAFLAAAATNFLSRA